MNFSDALFAPVYAALGVSAILTPQGTGAAPVTITALDKTRGIDLTSLGEAEFNTQLPGAKVRSVELADNSISVTDLVGGTLEINGTEWRIESYRPRASPNGLDDGEVWLILGEIDA